MVGDPLADFLNQIKNAALAGKNEISVPYSMVKHAVADILKEKGFIASVEKKGKKVRKTLSVSLNEPIETIQVKRVSKPSRRSYIKAKDIHQVRAGKGLLIISTPNGILAGDDARKQNVGGEVICKIW